VQVYYRCDAVNKQGWLYVGSHNLSPSAWGRADKTSFYICNYELGVVFCSSPDHGAICSVSVLRNCWRFCSEFRLEDYPLPFKCPPEKYPTGTKPWCGQIQWQKP